jgi:hypothetical protein
VRSWFGFNHPNREPLVLKYIGEEDDPYEDAGAEADEAAD